VIVFGAPRTQRHPAVGGNDLMEPLHRLRSVLSWVASHRLASRPEATSVARFVTACPAIAELDGLRRRTRSLW
jgi:hypothetical protein